MDVIQYVCGGGGGGGGRAAVLTAREYEELMQALLAQLGIDPAGQRGFTPPPEVAELNRKIRILANWNYVRHKFWEPQGEIEKPFIGINRSASHRQEVGVWNFIRPVGEEQKSRWETLPGIVVYLSDGRRYVVWRGEFPSDPYEFGRWMVKLARLPQVVRIEPTDQYPEPPVEGVPAVGLEELYQLASSGAPPGHTPAPGQPPTPPQGMVPAGLSQLPTWLPWALAAGILAWGLWRR